MKTTISTKLLLFVAVASLLAASQQTRTISQVRAENRQLLQTQTATEQALRQSKEAAAASNVQAAEEAQSLRTEIATLRSDLQEARSQIEQFSPASRLPLASDAKHARTRSGLPQISTPEIKRIFHLRPGALTNLPPKVEGTPYVHSSRGPFDDVNLWSGISEETVLQGPQWNPSAPLPLSFRNAEEIARKELSRFAQDEPDWELRELSLHGLWNPPRAPKAHLVERSSARSSSPEKLRACRPSYLCALCVLCVNPCAHCK